MESMINGDEYKDVTGKYILLHEERPSCEYNVIGEVRLSHVVGHDSGENATTFELSLPSRMIIHKG